MKIFINAKTQAICDSVSAALNELDAQVHCCYDDETADTADLSEYDIIIVSTPLRSEFGLNYIAGVTKRTSACIICLAKTELAEDVQNRIKFTGAYVLPRPFTKGALIQTVKMAMLARDNMQRLRSENTELSRRLDDTKIINRAKCCLIQYLNFTEEQAQQHIHRLAMDSRRTKREIAEDILHTYTSL
ncbi:MAG: ANTAR domain-containing protein [Oscillospiraceae bacterium]|nr:ANTAR domain-containing protein [Oscillospiraceae bacterium]